MSAVFRATGLWVLGVGSANPIVVTFARLLQLLSATMNIEPEAKLFNHVLQDICDSVSRNISTVWCSTFLNTFVQNGV